ncbi:hypothetical protein LCGC14_1672400 [marine sediment metagenome]|uniref:Uncharacterized protein n=1 Tax=marine sediment metagenome TaxID=412755 RepID=A0A0F9HQX8_9ZZZZ
MKLNMDEARRREARERCDWMEKNWSHIDGGGDRKEHDTITLLEELSDYIRHARTDLPDALADIDTLLGRLKGLLLVIENYTKVHAPPPVVQIEIERARGLLDEAHD